MHHRLQREADVKTPPLGWGQHRICLDACQAAAQANAFRGQKPAPTFLPLQLNALFMVTLLQDKTYQGGFPPKDEILR